MYNSIMNQDLDLKDRLDRAQYAILSQISSGEKRLDLYKMYRPCQTIWAEMDKEFITCRRVWKITPKYNDLQAQLEENLNTLEQYLVFAKLTD